MELAELIAELLKGHAEVKRLESLPDPVRPDRVEDARSDVHFTAGQLIEAIRADLHLPTIP